MSATNRGGQRSEADFYATPSWCTRRLLERVHFPGVQWLEPGAGDGSVIRAARNFRPDVHWTAVELRDVASPFGQDPAISWWSWDFLKWSCADDAFDVAMGNPPYALALPFVERARKFASVVAFLLRLDFIGSQGRADFMRSSRPSVYVLPDRPSFRGKGTDSNEYAWFVWGLNVTPEIHVLGSTSAEEKAHDRGQLSLMPSTAQESMLR